MIVRCISVARPPFSTFVLVSINTTQFELQAISKKWYAIVESISIIWVLEFEYLMPFLLFLVSQFWNK